MRRGSFIIIIIIWCGCTMLAACGVSLTGQPVEDVDSGTSSDASLTDATAPQGDGLPTEDASTDGVSPQPGECVTLLDSLGPFQIESDGPVVVHVPGIGAKIPITKNKSAQIYATFTAKKNPFTKSRVDLHLNMGVIGEWGSGAGDYAHLLHQYYGTDRVVPAYSSTVHFRMAQAAIDVHTFAPAHAQITLPSPALPIPAGPDTHLIATTEWGPNGTIAVTSGTSTRFTAALTASSPATDKLTLSIGGDARGAIPEPLEIVVMDVCVTLE